MLAKGPELRLEIIPADQQDQNQASWTVDIDVFKGRKNVFKGSISLTKSDGNKLQNFLIDKYKS